MDLIHHITQGNRRFLIMKDPATDMRGFIMELRRVTPSGVRGETMLEVFGVERYLADVVYIPEDRRDLYQNENEALKFANGNIIKDREIMQPTTTLEERQAVERELAAKLTELERLFNTQFITRATNQDQQV